jgi:hypothetical protein
MVYRPERWLEEGGKELEKALNSESSCRRLGRRGLMNPPLQSSPLVPGKFSVDATRCECDETNVVYLRRSCVGRKYVHCPWHPLAALTDVCSLPSVAMMELLIFISTLVFRYDLQLSPEYANKDELDIAEGFLRKVCHVSLLAACDGH